MGYLPVLSSKTNSSLEIFVVAGRLDTTSSALNISVSGVPSDDYNVVVFDLGSNGLPPALSGNINYAAAEEENITVTNPGEAESKGHAHLGICFHVLYMCTYMHTYLCVYAYPITHRLYILVFSRYRDSCIFAI